MIKPSLLLTLSITLHGVAMANPAHNQIAALPEPQRLSIFSKLLQSEDSACRNVSKAFFRGQDNKGAAYWAVQCTQNKAYQVQISPNATGSTNILDCAVMKALGSECFGKFK